VFEELRFGVLGRHSEDSFFIRVTLSFLHVLFILFKKNIAVCFRSGGSWGFLNNSMASDGTPGGHFPMRAAAPSSPPLCLHPSLAVGGVCSIVLILWFYFSYPEDILRRPAAADPAATVRSSNLCHGGGEPVLSHHVGNVSLDNNNLLFARKKCAAHVCRCVKSLQHLHLLFSIVVCVCVWGGGLRM